MFLKSFGVASSCCKENSACPFKRSVFDYLNILVLSVLSHTLIAHS